MKVGWVDEWTHYSGEKSHLEVSPENDKEKRLLKAFAEYFEPSEEARL